MAENGYLIISLSSCCKTLERKKKVHLKRINLPNLSLSTPLLQLPKFLDLHWPAVVSVALEVDVNNGGSITDSFVTLTLTSCFQPSQGQTQESKWPFLPFSGFFQALEIIREAK